MKSKLTILACLFVFSIAGSIAWADQILLKNGQKYSGKFMGGDAQFVEFQILGDIHKFKTMEVAQIVFEQPELIIPPAQKQVAAPRTADVSPAQRQSQRAEGTMSSQPSQSVTPATDPAVPSVTLPKGTPMRIRTVDPIDTDRNRVGDEFQAVLDEPLSIGSQIIVPKGADVTGRIAHAEESGMTGQSMLILELRELTFNGRSYAILTSDYSSIGESQGKETATTIGGGAAIGALIGAVAGGRKGAAIGAGTGAAVGTGVRVLTRGETLKVPAETVLEFKLQRPLTIELR